LLTLLIARNAATSDSKEITWQSLAHCGDTRS